MDADAKRGNAQEHAQDPISSQIAKELVQPSLPNKEGLEHAVSLWLDAATAEAKQLEVTDAPSKRREDNVRFWASTIAPLVGSLALVATLGFQIFQFRKSDELQRASLEQASDIANATAKLQTQGLEDQRWQSVTARLVSEKSTESATGWTLLASFLDSPTYGKDARKLACELLGHYVARDACDLLLPQLVRETNSGNIQDLVELTKNLADSADQASGQLLDLENGGDTSIPGLDGEMRQGMPKAEQLAELHDVEYQFYSNLWRVDGEILKLLNKDRKQYSNLAGIAFTEYDLSNQDFSGCNLDGAHFYRCIVNKSRFRNLASSNDISFEGTAWWRVQSMDGGLVTQLKKDPDSQYDPKGLYAKSKTPSSFVQRSTESQRTYDAYVKTLKG